MAGFSVKKPLTVFVAVLGIIVLGVVAYLKMTPDLLPNMDFPLCDHCHLRPRRQPRIGGAGHHKAHGAVHVHAG